MSQIQRSLEAKLKFLRIVEEKGGILITGYTKTHVKPQYPPCPPAATTPVAEVFQQLFYINIAIFFT